MRQKFKILENSDRAGPYPIRLFDPVDEHLERLYKTNCLKNPTEFPLDVPGQPFFLAPNGDYLWYNDEVHDITVDRILTKLPISPNRSLRPSCAEKIISFCRELNIIKVSNNLKSDNRIDYVFFTPINQAQLRAIYRTYKDIPDLWITYDIIDHDKPRESSGAYFETSGEGYRELLTDLRKMDYLLN